jgi:hypothetical protein
MIRNVIAIGAVLLFANFTSHASAQTSAPSQAEIRAAVEKALPLLAKGAAGSMKERPNCFTCHNAGMPVLAMKVAQTRGFEIDDKVFADQLQLTTDYLGTHEEDFLTGRGTGGQVATAGAALWALETGDYQPDEVTAAVAQYLAGYQKDLGHWKMTSDRPPTESSHFTANFLAIQGLKAFAPELLKAKADERIEKAKKWLIETPAKETEDRVFRLWSLKLVGADHEIIRKAGETLLKTQRPDGGWAQLDGTESDPYATGSALVALFESGISKSTDEAYVRGMKYLLTTQLPDGSWFVRSRSKPFQKYYESGFPHGNDQFVSIAASSWATTALALACPEKSGNSK